MITINVVYSKDITEVRGDCRIIGSDLAVLNPEP